MRPLKKSALARWLVSLASLGVALVRLGASPPPPLEFPADALRAGFVLQPLHFEVQHPYDLKLAERYSYDPATDTHDLWVFESDKPHLPPPNKTEARTELRLLDNTYKPGSGLHMMDCDLFITPGTFACISQVFGTGPMCILIVNREGTISDLRTHAVIAEKMNGRWFHWTLIHDPDGTGPGAVKVYVDGKLADDKIVGRKQASFYFKIGVYSREGSDRNEVKVRNLRYLIRPPGSGGAGATPSPRP